MRCILVCAGELRTDRVNVEDGDFVIAVDGGMESCRKLGIVPDLVLGDFDSAEGTAAEVIRQLEQKESGRVLRLPCEKDDTDTLAALKEGLRRGYREFMIYGGTGGRFDHTLANIQCLLFLRNQGARGYLLGKREMTFLIHRERVSFPPAAKGTLSLFSMSEESGGVTIEGLKYTTEKATLRNDFPIGISNEFIGQSASVEVAEGSLVCMISCEEEIDFIPKIIPG